MKYCSTDELNTFAFHDSVLYAHRWSGGVLNCELMWVIVTAKNSRNDRGENLCAEQARVTLTGARFEGARLLGRRNEAKALSRDEFADLVRGALARDLIFPLGLSDYRRDEGGRYSALFTFLPGGDAGVCELTLSFDRADVRWNAYTGQSKREDPYAAPEWREASA